MPTFLISLFSNGDLKQHPRNTLTKFTNSFAEPLKPKKSDFFKIRLRTIMVSHKTIIPDENADVIKVYVNETEPQTSTYSNFETCLGSFDTKNADQHGLYTFFEFEHTPYIKIRKVPFDQISILITNGINQQLQLEPSYPTILIMEVTDSPRAQQFQITCYSHLLSPDRENLYPNNELHGSVCHGRKPLRNLELQNRFVRKNRVAAITAQREATCKR